MVNAVTHGNEICGAIAVDQFLRQGVRPIRGRLSFAFVNHMAFGRFDPASPHDTRFVDEDLNRVWDGERLDGDDDSAELRRARELRATFDSVDRLLDIHSMGSKSLPLIICHGLEKERRLAREVSYPGQVVCGSGHVQGRRLIEYAPYNDPKTDKIAVLVECGQHWARETATAAVDTAAHFLRATGAIGDDVFRDLVTEATPPPQRFLEVTGGVAAKTDSFRFAERYKGLETFFQGGQRDRPRRGRTRGHAPRRLRADHAQPSGRQGTASPPVCPGRRLSDRRFPVPLSANFTLPKVSTESRQPVAISQEFAVGGTLPRRSRGQGLSDFLTFVPPRGGMPLPSLPLRH